MTKTRQLLAGLAVALASWFTAGSADARVPHSWVSSTGNGTACTRTAPYADFFTAQNATNAGEVISVLDPGDYGGLTLTKSLTIRAEGVDGGATSEITGGFWVAVNAGASDVVTLEGLHFSGAGGSILFVGRAHLQVVRCVFTNQNFSGCAGIRFAPNSATKLSVTDTVINNFGSGTGGGIVINPQSGGGAQVNLERVTVNGNALGIAADGSNSIAGINMTIADSVIGGNSQDGVIATTPGGDAPIGITKSVNKAFGIRPLGPNVTVRAFIVAQSYCATCADTAATCRGKCNGAGRCIQACDDAFRDCVDQNCRRRY
jgi:hypothetical protein